MTSTQIRNSFLAFFESKKHHIVPSAPMVIKNDPTLMFTNAGMNQFKDIFLANSEAKFPRVTDAQKCLRVSGKHNDLEEVGRDTYHHTMFEMLGNWSFGDYFKKEAIAWAWEYLTKVLKIEKDDLYITVFGGDTADGLDVDSEAYEFWKALVPEDKIIYGSKKDNFWEMGDTGPCGPCSEIHIDMRDQKAKEKIAGRDLVNEDHPEVIEIWNLVFIEFNRLANGDLVPLPAKHVDTGMGFERLVRVLQHKKSNYDTDVFMPLIIEICRLTNYSYGSEKDKDIAVRVIADHLRAVAFAIADGQLPSNNKAGYVIRRILRRAVRYAYTYLNTDEPLVHSLVAVLVKQMGDFYTNLNDQSELIQKVIREEEASFLRTLHSGIQKYEAYLDAHNSQEKIIKGEFAFELYDTFGFPIDLTALMASENGWSIDMQGFEKHLEAQKSRSRQAAAKNLDDWVIVHGQPTDESVFCGYESLIEKNVRILRYRKVVSAKNVHYQLVFDRTPCYAESGGQVGDRATIYSGEQSIAIEDTLKENNLIVHIVPELPKDPAKEITILVDERKRLLTTNNHSATHLMHAALKQVLGDHVEQKGSLVNEEYMRFDFSHFSKMSQEEIRQVEQIVNARIRENIVLDEKRDVAMDEAIAMGATALFGEKYGDHVRVITFNPEFSVELCGGTHVQASGQIGSFRILSEGAIAAGIRRIEACTADKAEAFADEHIDLVHDIKAVFKNQKDILKAVKQMVQQNVQLQKEVDKLNREKALGAKDQLINSAEILNGIKFIGRKIEGDAQAAKDLAFAIKAVVDDFVLVLAYEANEKAGLTIMVSERIAEEKGLNAGKLIREAAREIKGGGGGQAHFASAGGKDASGIEAAILKVKSLIQE